LTGPNWRKANPEAKDHIKDCDFVVTRLIPVKHKKEDA
jgi:hypothetical protein